jgi:cation transport regulator ChaC
LPVARNGGPIPLRPASDQAAVAFEASKSAAISASAAAIASRWIEVETAQGRLRAIAFVIDRRGHIYAGGLTPDEVADIVAKACGHGGSCAEYLYSTILHLEDRGIRDRNLWRLQSLVAQKIASMTAPLQDEHAAL